MAEMPHYRLPRRMMPGFAWSFLTLRPRSLCRDAEKAVATLRRPMEVAGAENVPAEGPCLVVTNHYSPLWFPSWWLALCISAAVSSRRAPSAEREIHWVMAAAWTYPDSPWRGRVLTPATYWAFRRVARIYGFVTMPPMPPTASEVEARALAVRQTLRLASALAPAGGMLGLSPEGQAVRDTHLQEPPPGVGTFIALLVQAGLPLLPVGVAETEGCLRLSFGPTFEPWIPAARHQRDREVARQVIRAIEQLLP
jgi:1-acyl-sn-glycerol-3-phosphate acyltransferase